MWFLGHLFSFFDHGVLLFIEDQMFYDANRATNIIVSNKIMRYIVYIYLTALIVSLIRNN